MLLKFVLLQYMLDPQLPWDRLTSLRIYQSRTVRPGQVTVICVSVQIDLEEHVPSTIGGSRLGSSSGSDGIEA